MTVDEFLDRVQTIILQVNDSATLGQNKIGITTDQRIEILGSNNVDEAAKYLIAYGIPQYIVDFATSGTDITTIGADDAALAAAGEQFGLYGGAEALLGVPANYIPPRESATDFYTESDLVNLFAGLEEEQIAGIQADLINAKLLNVGAGFIPGEWDGPTQQAFTFVLARANRAGVTEAEKQNGAAWRSTLKEFVANPVPTIPDDDVFLPQDPATNAQAIKSYYAREVNRDPSPYELKLLANQLYKDSEAAYNQSKELGQIAQAQPAFTGEDLLAGQYGNYAADNVQQAINDQGLTQIDPTSRMRENVDELLVNEKARLGENYSARNTRSVILNAIGRRPE
jgi:hypothetical protein